MAATLRATLDTISPISDEHLAAARERQAQLTKPAGSLGLIEEVGIRLAGIARQCPPPVPSKAVVGVFAGDHGVCAQGVTPWPQEVTVQMLLNMAEGGAAISVLSAELGARTMLTDVGVAGDYPEHPDVRRCNVAPGTADLSMQPAMTREQAEQAIEVGIEAALEAIDGGAEILLTGDMGIGNTTASTALIAVFTGAAVDEVTGKGAGLNDVARVHKAEVIQRALDLHQLSPADPLGALAAVGGFEHAGIVGFILGAASRRIPVILDGVIACSSALVAVGLCEAVRGYLISGHAGVEPGIVVAVQSLGLSPLVDLGLRLGEGSGAVLALPLVRASARVLRDMATFAEVGIAH